MEGKIISVLKESPTPLTAAEIARKIPGCIKKDVNQKLYHINGVKSVEGTQPPKWRLVEQCQTKVTKETEPIVVANTDTPVNKQKSTDDEIKPIVIEYLQSQTSPISGPSISRSISSKINNCITADIKRVLGELEREGSVRNHSLKGEKPLWSLKKSLQNKPETATFKGKRLFVAEDKENGGISLDPVTLEELHEGVNHPVTPVPLSETIEPCIQPVEESSGQLEEPSIQPIEPSGIPSKNPTEACKKKTPVQLAANFTTLTIERSEKELYEQVLQFLKSRPGIEFTDHAVAKDIGCSTRQKVLYILDKLVDEGIAEKMNNHTYKLYN